jgi:hypothetical protein
MAKFPWSCSSTLLTIALVTGLGLGAAGCAVESDEPASAEPAVIEQSAPLLQASGPGTPAAFPRQVTFICEDFSNGNVFAVKSTLAACEAACPAPAVCFRCALNINDCI